jgi:hypothetical protein
MSAFGRASTVQARVGVDEARAPWTLATYMIAGCGTAEHRFGPFQASPIGSKVRMTLASALNRAAAQRPYQHRLSAHPRRHSYSALEEDQEHDRKSR